MIQRKTKRRRLAFITACLTAAMAVLPYMPERAEAASGDQVEAWGDGWHFYCIDGHTYATNGVCTNGDLYEEVSADTLLNEQEQVIVFWAMLSFKADKGDSNAQKFLNLINVNAAASGLMPISKKVNEEDLKGVIHSAAVRAHYPWLDFAVAHAEDYMKLMGVLGGGSTNGGGKIPSALQGSASLATAVKPVKQGDAWVIQFDPNGADADFIAKVPLQFLAAGSEVSENGTWVDTPPGGWNVTKTSTQIRFTNPDPNAAMLNIRFNPQNTDYESVSEQFSSPQEMYVSTLQTVKPVRCSGKHKAGGKTHPIEEHQRNADLMFKNFPVFYFASLGGSTSQAEGSGSFQVFRHEEDMEAHYNVRIHKYDYETGKPLEKARFNLYERFDDKDQVNQERDGHVEIYEGGDPYASYIIHEPAVWSGFRLVTSLLTDQNGQASYTLEKGYHYDKTFCNGHPAPELSEVPEEETDPETGEVLNGDAIEDAKAENREAAQEWLDTLAACEEKASGAFDGVHFHWLSGNVSQGAIEDAASSGEKTSVGSTSGASGEESYERSGAKADCQATYEKFISLEYSYTFKESTAREGYTVHGAHTDDVPIEIITTDSSENGANSRFEGGYSSEISRTTGWQLNPPEQAPVPGDSSSQKGVGLAQGEREEASYYGSPYLERIRESVQASLLLYPSDSLNPDGEGTPSEVKTKATISEIATDSDLIPEEDGYGWGEVSFSGMTGLSDALSVGTGSMEALTFSVSARSSGGQFDAAYSEALSSGSVGDEVDKGDDGNLSHGVTDSWKVYDHRTEGEVHFNKKDLDLAAGEDADFNAYGETEGDGTLEGAVYGLFAREDIVHPDGKTGVVFEQNDLVAVASTDKNGDGSFVAITEAPGHTYDYGTGQVVETESGWAKKAPGNLFTGEKALDDYTEDGSFQGKETKRIYQDNLGNNGNPWIGRPLLLGKYYIKELSRSEGYELSVNGKTDPVSNQGYDLDVTMAKGEGSVAVTRAPYVEPQSSGMDEDTMPNVLHFTVRSEGTKDTGFDLAFTGYPEGTKLYRLDSGTEIREEQVPTGEKEKKLLYDAFGDPVWKVAEEDNRYPKRNPDGSFQTEEVTVNAVVSSMPVIREGVIDVGKTENTLTTGSDPATGQADRDRNQGTLTMADGEAEYLKYKLEQALRANGFATPKKNGSYTTRNAMAYDRGSRNGETVIYGAPVTEVLVPKESGGSPVTIGDALLTLLDYYSRNGQFTYGGLDGYEDSGSQWVFRLYAGFPGNPEDVYSSQANSGTAYHRVEYLPDDPAHSPRYVYADYTADGNGVFGRLENFQTWETGGASRCSATLVTDAVADGNGDLHSKTVSRNVYFRKGEILTDQYGNRIQDYEWVDKMTTVTTEVPVTRWSEIPVSLKNGVLVAHMDSRYTDGFGAAHSDEAGADYTMKAVLPKEMIKLSQEDAEKLPPEYGYQAGEEIGYGDYVLAVSKGTLSAYLDFQDQSLTGDGLYVEETELTYPGQGTVFQDGGTRTEPVQVYERPIRQKVKITKDITSYKDNTYGIEEVPAMANFRFKAYLRSNLERLYRDEEGKVAWVDKNGNEVSYEELLDQKAPAGSDGASVPKLYTRVPHLTDSRTTGSISNNTWEEAVTANEVLYGFQDGFLSGEQNPGYTRVLETMEQTVTDENGTERQVTAYNYEKFFDAVYTANTDVWDAWRPADGHTPSDAVRQFAIRWYLDWEVEKLVQDNGNGETEPVEGGESYQDEIYDKALSLAVEKAENYLKPFFSYDLDRIYAVDWDSARDGGSDGDDTTLSADIPQGEDSYVGISRYLPYGIYVVVEQQPERADLEDFANKHYQTELPKEITVPSVYEGETGEWDSTYSYDSALSREAQAAAYQIRFGEEWDEAFQTGAGGHVVKAHNRDGDFEVYPYGLETDKLTGTGYEGYRVSQSLYRPYKDIYHTENGASWYPNEAVAAYYRYGSVSEDHGLADGVLFAKGANDLKEETAQVRDRVKTATGALTAYEGQYAPALVPWSMREPEDGQGSSGIWSGYGESSWHNTLYHAFLRIEKTDRETGEDILHDGAVFAIYRADREEDADGEGRVRFYEEDTVIHGSREFLEAMGAWDITPVAKGGIPPYLGAYYGTVPAGTPVCLESDQVFLTDREGARTGTFEAFSTTRDLLLPDPDTGEVVWENQTTGYLETPEPLGAGTYVIAEVKPPAGYVRTAPIAVEVYSDRVEYYRDGDRDDRVTAAIYEYEDPQEGAGEEVGLSVPSMTDTSRILVGNTPVRLSVRKEKTESGETTTLFDGRVNGSIAELKGRYGLENLELAYNQSGKYLGYGWKKGFLEEMEALQQAGEPVELLYEGGIFTGQARFTGPVSAAQDEDRFLPGATLTLYEGIPLTESGGTEDIRYEGLTVERGLNGAVSRMYLKKGYAGERVVFLKENAGDLPDPEEEELSYSWTRQEDDTGEGTWTYRTVQREDTDILFYSLAGLTVMEEQDGQLLGYDRQGKTIPLRDGEPAFALKDGKAYLELVCPDYASLHYDRYDSVFDRVPEGTELYHVDSDGNRDSLVDPYTGMAYAKDDAGQVQVWPVTLHRDEDGRLLSMEKIRTYRVAIFQDGDGKDYTIGTYDSRKNDLIKEMNPVLDEHGLPVYYQKSEEEYRKGEAVYDRDGDFLYYRYDDGLTAKDRNAYIVEDTKDLKDIGTDPETMEDDDPLFHRQGEAYLMENTWVTGDDRVNDPFRYGPTTGQEDVLKRVVPGSYILEETRAPEGYARALPIALTVEETDTEQTVTMNDEPTKVIIEKVDAPDDYRGTVEDRHQVLSGTETYEKAKGTYTYAPVSGAGLALYPAKKRVADGETIYEKTSDTPASWTVLTSDNQEKTVTGTWVTGSNPIFLEGIPAGTYLLEETEAPSGHIRNSIPMEVSPLGEVQRFVLPDDHTQAAFLKYMEEDGTAVPMPNRHRAELTLYEAETDGNGNILTDENGIPRYRADRPVDTWQTDDCLEYTKTVNTFQYGNDGFLSWLQELTGIGNDRYLTGFCWDYEKLFAEYGDTFTSLSWKAERTAVRDSEEDGVWLTSRGDRIVTEGDRITFPEGISPEDREGFEAAYRAHKDREGLSWLVERTAKRLSSETTGHGETVTQTWQTEEGSVVRITSYRDLMENGTYGRKYEYQFNYRELDQERYPGAASYDTADGRHHLDRLPLGEEDGQGRKQGLYVLVETGTPKGFLTAEPKEVVLEETKDLQLYAMENDRPHILVGKKRTDGTLLEGARLGLYRPDGNGAFSEDPDLLITSWVSGSDGTYTEADEENGKIPEGMKVGDLRLHRIDGVGEGTYYLAELEPPPYYLPMLPEKIKVEEGRPWVFFAVNEEKTGMVEVEKTGEDGKSSLSGAVFTLENLDTGKTYLLVTDGEGKASVDGLPVGKAGKYGVIEPYRYRITETVPPEHHEVSMEPVEFIFTDSTAIRLWWGLKVSDRETEIWISKKDFKDGVPVKGAVLAVYEAVEQDGRYEAEGEALETWVSDGDRHKVKGKLSAGRTYLLKELSAPEGYVVAEPMIFTVSEDGKGVSSVRDSRLMIRSILDPSGDILGLETIGRQPVDTRLSITNLETGVMETRQATGRTEELLEEEGYRDGDLCRVEEQVVYSDGRVETVSSLTFRIGLTDGRYQVPTAYGIRTELELYQTDGKHSESEKEKKLLDTWIPEASEGYAHRTENREGSGEDIFRSGQEYRLVETTVFTDGRRETTGMLQFRLGEDGQPEGLELFDRPTEASLSKQAFATGKELPGAQMVLKEADGTVVETWRSGTEPHVIRGTLEPGKTYILEETEAPAGYLLAEPVRFTVSEDGTIDRVVMEDKKKPGGGDPDGTVRVTILKYDQATLQGLPGAEFIICREDGSLYQTVRTGEDGTIRFDCPEPGRYLVQETEAPEGYEQSDQVYSFEVTASGRVEGDLKIPNEEETVVRKLGRIFGEYTPFLDGTGGWKHRYDGKWVIPETGDGSLLLPALLLGMAGLAGWYLTGKKRKLFFAFLLVGGMSIPAGRETFAASMPETVRTEKVMETATPSEAFLAEEMELGGERYRLEYTEREVLSVVVKPGRQIVRESEPFLENEPELPPETIEMGESLYRLVSMETEEVILEEEQKEVSGEILYEVEKGYHLPETGEILVEDGLVGELSYKLPLLRKTEGEWKWTDGFSFPLTIENYGADLYALGDTWISQGADLMDHGPDILESMGLDPEYYRIQEIRWQGGPYLENGVLYRKAQASGLKKVCTVKALYSGTVTIPERKAKVRRTVYQDRPDEKAYQIRLAGTYRKVREPWWREVLGDVITFLKENWLGISIFLVWIVILLFLVRGEKKGGKKK